MVSPKNNIHNYIYIYISLSILKYTNTLHGTYRSYIILNMFNVYTTRSRRMYNINLCTILL